MCLETITKNLKGKSNRVETGWKVFELKSFDTFYSKKGLYPSYKSRSAPFEINQWIEDINDFMINSDMINKETGWYRRYQTGFHLFKTKSAAQQHTGDSEIAIKIRYRKSVARGRQWGEDVIVAREIFIPKNWRRYIKRDHR